MKEELAGKNIIHYDVNRIKGFSTLELMIAFAILCIVLVGAVESNFAAKYWVINSQTANEGLYKAKTGIEDLRADAKEDFYKAISSPLAKSVDIKDPADASCIAGGLCYYVQKTVTDISSCSKYIEADVKWQVPNYPETSTKLFTYLTNSPEIIARGGDCILGEPSGDWTNSPQKGGQGSPGKIFTGIDVLHNKIYTTSSTSPYFTIYEAPATPNLNPIQLSPSTDIVKVISASVSLNAIDVEEDLSSGRTYAFVSVNATSKQLAVIDVTDSANPMVVAQRDLANVDPLGSSPQGWRMYIYGGRLYIITKETGTAPNGKELHIFDISNPIRPTEVANYELGRTINDFVVRDQKIGNINHRLMFLAEHGGSIPYDSQLKILDVTNDIVTPLSASNLNCQEGMSLSLLGNNLYFGCYANASDAELYVFNISTWNGSLPSIISPVSYRGEVGASVTKIEAIGKYLFIGTNKSGQELQAWNSDYTTWTGSTNVGRYSSYSLSNLVPLGFDIDSNSIYTIGADISPVNNNLNIIYKP